MRLRDANDGNPGPGMNSGYTVFGTTVFGRTALITGATAPKRIRGTENMVSNVVNVNFVRVD